ncbi:MAG TPA: hypothetical protein VN947_13770 [Polyangia bacterium]|nr:hypothetical protein [Polyangia bacterium]
MKLIGIYGIDGSGKTTQVKMLLNALKRRGRRAEFITMQSDARTAAHRIAWAEGKSSAFECFDDAALLLCGAFDVLRLTQSWPRDAGDEHSIVVDRYVPCFKATAAARGLTDFGQADLVFRRYPRPAHEFFLRIDAGRAVERILAREGGAFDNHAPQYLGRYQEAYERIVAATPSIRVLDASEPAEALHQIIAATVIGA